MTMPTLIPGCIWASHNVLVSELQEHELKWPKATLDGFASAGRHWVLNLLSEEQFKAGGSNRMIYNLWLDDESLPTARQVRQTLDLIEETHATGLFVLLHSWGSPARAAIAAGCWLARQGGTTDKASLTAARLGWLDAAEDSTARGTRHLPLDEARREFICEWPDREGEPVRTRTELMENDEVYPWATVEYWLRTLPSVRFYPDGFDGRSVVVPILEGGRISDGVDIHLELGELLTGTWVSERTLELRDGGRVVFKLPNRRGNK